jgi:hypothetical protein
MIGIIVLVVMVSGSGSPSAKPAARQTRHWILPGTDAQRSLWLFACFLCPLCFLSEVSDCCIAAWIIALWLLILQDSFQHMLLQRWGCAEHPTFLGNKSHLCLQCIRKPLSSIKPTPKS